MCTSRTSVSWWSCTLSGAQLEFINFHQEKTGIVMQGMGIVAPDISPTLISTFIKIRNPASELNVCDNIRHFDSNRIGDRSRCAKQVKEFHQLQYQHNDILKFKIHGLQYSSIVDFSIY